MAHGGRRVYLLLRGQQHAVDIAALHAHRNGQLIQTDAPFPGGVGRQAGNDLLTAAHALLNGGAPVVAGADVALVEPGLMAALLERFVNALTDGAFRVAVAQKQPHGLKFLLFGRRFKPVAACTANAPAPVGKNFCAAALRAAERVHHPIVPLFLFYASSIPWIPHSSSFRVTSSSSHRSICFK